MAEKLCELKKKGGGGGAKQTETVLWTNPSPTSNWTDQSVTLSESISNYKYVKFVWKVSTSVSTQESMIVPVTDFKIQTAAANTPQAIMGVHNSSATPFTRRIFYVNDTSIRILGSQRVMANAADDSLIIPLEILGLNELAHAKGFNESVLWTNSAPTSSFAKQDVTLSDDINNYDYLKFTYRVTTSVADSLNYIISVSDFKKSVENPSIYNCVFGLTTDDSAAHTRRVYYKNDTTVNFNNAYQLNAVASNNATVVPTSIVGCKFR